MISSLLSVLAVACFPADSGAIFPVCLPFSTVLMMSGRLNSYLVDIEEQAQERFERIVEQMKQAQGITERLKADNAWEWVGRMNNIQACAREIVDKEIIYQ